jgi:hypothetical protein
MQDSFQFAIDPTAALEELLNDVLWRGRRSKSGDLLVGKPRKVLEVLRYHKGRDNAKPLSELAEKLGMNAREIKQQARTLTIDFGIPIGAARQEPYGYFLCVTQEDYAAALRPYMHEIQALAERMRVLKAPARLLEILGQLQVELDEERTA